MTIVLFYCICAKVPPICRYCHQLLQIINSRNFCGCKLQLHSGDSYFQTNDNAFSILSEAHSQLSSLPTAHRLCLQSKKLNFEEHLDTFSVQCKSKDSIQLWSLEQMITGIYCLLYFAYCSKLAMLVHSMYCKVCLFSHSCNRWLSCYAVLLTVTTHSQVLNCLATEISKLFTAP